MGIADQESLSKVAGRRQVTHTLGTGHADGALSGLRGMVKGLRHEFSDRDQRPRQTACGRLCRCNRWGFCENTNQTDTAKPFEDVTRSSPFKSRGPSPESEPSGVRDEASTPVLG